MTRRPKTLQIALLSLSLIGGAAGYVGGGSAEAAPNPFRVESAAPALKAGAKDKIRITVVVPEGYHAYRDMMSVVATDPAGLTLGEASFPPGLTVPDPANPGATREQYDFDVLIDVPVTAPKAGGTFNPTFHVVYQGCKKGVCYPPVEADITVPVTVNPPAKGAIEAPGATLAAALPPPAEISLVSTVGGGAPPADHGTTLHAGPALAPPAIDLSAVPPGATVRTVDAQGKAHPVTAYLLADHDAVVPGQPLRLGVLLVQQEGWHTYWRSPGDIGLPTQITWGLPAGVSAAPFAFPAPARFELQGIVSYGYDGQVLLSSDLTVPAGLTGGTLPVTAEVSWLVCQSSCIPGSASLKLELPIAAAHAASSAAPLFDAYAKALPVPTASVSAFAVESAISASAVHPDEDFKAAFLIHPTGDKPLDLQHGPGSWPIFTPIIDGSWMLMGATTTPAEGGGLLVVLEGRTFDVPDPLPAADKVGGLIQIKVGPGEADWVRTELTTPLPWVAKGAAVTASPSPLFSMVTASSGGAPPSGDGAVAAAGPGADPSERGPSEPPPAAQSFPMMMLLAFFGGVLLNIMPCVLPVLTLKLYSLVGQGEISDRERQTAGVAYSAGIIASFLALATVVIGLRSVMDIQVGWGFQFQYPGYVAILATIVFVFGLSLFGVFEIPAVGADAASKTAHGKEGIAGYFLTGVFATLLATPCSAPFLGTGMGFALSLPPAGILLFFGLAGLGLAAPFLLIAFVPVLYRFLPRPGEWMITFKQVLGFSLIATTVWLIDVLGAQVGRDGMTGYLAFLTFVGFGAWLFGRYGSAIETGARQIGVFAAAVALSAFGGWRFLHLDFAPAEGGAPTALQAEGLDFSEHIPWQAFSEARVDELAGKTVFIDFTAEWCLTCKVNEKTVLSSETVRGAMKAQGVVPLKADWTRRDEVITRWLQRYGRAGVPFYLVIPADRSAAPIPLPEVITPDIVLTALRDAG